MSFPVLQQLQAAIAAQEDHADFPRIELGHDAAKDAYGWRLAGARDFTPSTPREIAFLLDVRTLRIAAARQEEHPFFRKIELSTTGTTLMVRAGSQGAWQECSIEQGAAAIRERATSISLSQSDPLRFLSESEIWREIDLRMARKRLEQPGVVLRLLVTGGIRSAKTEGCTRRTVANFFYTTDAWVWFTHETQTTSKSIQQPRVFRFIPEEVEPESGKMKKGKTTKFNYSEGTGFSGDNFNFRWQVHDENGKLYKAGGKAEFRFYKSDDSTFQGSELTCANSDELVPLKIVEFVDERLNSRAGDTRRPEFLAHIREAIRLLEARQPLPVRLLAIIYHGVHFLSFTPKEGYSPTVAVMMDGAVTIREELADPDLLPGKMVPRFKQPTNPAWLVAYLHTADNVFKGNWEGLKAQMHGKTEAEIRISCYGDVSKNWSVEFVPPFDPAHHVITSRGMIPRTGTFRLVHDPARARPWFMGLFLTDQHQRRYLVREWPQKGTQVPLHPCRSIPSQGEPGDWAVSSRREKINGDAGPAQELKLGWGFDQYTREIWSLLMEAGQWWFTPEERAEHEITITWERYPDWTLTGSPVPLYESWIDPRFSAVKDAKGAEEKDYIQSMDDAQIVYSIEGPGKFRAEATRRAIVPEPAPGKDIDTGDGLVVAAMGSFDASTFDPAAPSAMNCPDFRIWHECAAAIFTMHTFSIAPFKADAPRTDEACKDPRDVIAMHELVNPCHVNPEPKKRTGGARVLY